jgi:hypothetical protein
MAPAGPPHRGAAARLEHARTVGINLLSQADDLADSLVVLQREMSGFYARTIDDTNDGIDTDHIMAKVRRVLTISHF